MGVPVLAGWVAGGVTAGLMATIGAFTALYGSDRPYLNRAGHLGIIALSFAVAITLGVWAAKTQFLVVPVVVAIAMAATFLCNALRVGPPGAYMFALACAAGTSIGAAHLTPWHVGALVFAGGAFAWLLHMAGASFAPRGPEKLALRNAGNAVAAFIAAVGTQRQDMMRHQAALALHQVWTTLVSHQPVQPPPNGTLSRLRAESRELHMIFAEAIRTSAQGEPIPPDLAERARNIGVKPGPIADITDPRHIPLGRVSATRLLAEALRPGSHPFQIAARVGIAAAIAGLIGWAINLEHAYWAIAAAVLMLHQGLDWATTLQRGIQRVAGTFIGLLLAGAVLSLHPQGLWLAATMVVLQFIIEMLVVRNYGLAVIFITAIALTIAAGGHPVADVGHLLWVRGEDTAIGCVVGLAVFALGMRRAANAPISRELIRTWAAIDLVAKFLAKQQAIQPEARAARRNLQHQTILLLRAYDVRAEGGLKRRQTAERLWPAVVATQRLAYRLLAIGWQIESGPSNAADAPANSPFAKSTADDLHRTLANMTSAIRFGKKPAPLSGQSSLIEAELTLLYRSLVVAANPVTARPPAETPVRNA
jgi:uncharacterized membrane protein YccC